MDSQFISRLKKATRQTLVLAAKQGLGNYVEMTSDSPKENLKLLKLVLDRVLARGEEEYPLITKRIMETYRAYKHGKVPRWLIK